MLGGSHPAFPPITFFNLNSEGCERFLNAVPLPYVISLVPWNNHSLQYLNALDVLHIQWHVSGAKRLSSPYALVAADVDQSRSIDLADAALLKDILLGIRPQFPGNVSWRYLDASYVFPDPQDPFAQPLPESIVRDISLDSATYSFVAVKMGDVTCPGLQPNGDTPPSVSLALPDAFLQAGETLQIPLRFSEALWANALEAHLRFDAQAIEVLGTEQGTLAGESAQPKPGEWHWLWISPEQRLINSNQTLLSLRIRAKRPVFLRDVLHFDAERPSSLFDAQSEGRSLALAFSTVDTNAARPQDWSVQVSPNPTNGPLFFQLPNQAPREGVQLMLFSAQGTLMQQTTCSNGTCYLDTAQLPQGPYWYALRDGQGVWRATGRVTVF